ncbi:MAG: efflux RND transporter permease subunit [Saprospiraceae bacterium]|nr:efflux RND transporter permease subunit [Saprospiraceae bacterium]
MIGFYFTGVRDYPSVDAPTVTVSTSYPGANSEVIISQITEPLEESINGVDGIKTLTSTSSDGRSTITAEFSLETDLEAAANDVRDRVSRAQRSLPPDADPPVVSKSDAGGNFILSLTVQSDQRDLMDLTDIGNNLFKERLQTIPGISEIRIWGEKKYAMRLKMDPTRMSSLGITPTDIRTALTGANVELPSGRIEGTTTELTIRTLGSIETAEEFNQMVIKEENGQIIRFKDVGKAELAPENERTLLRGNDKIQMIGIAVNPQPGANYIAIADEFYKRVEIIKKDMPADLKLGYALDTTTNIRQAIEEVEETIIIAFSLVVMVIFLF